MSEGHRGNDGAAGSNEPRSGGVPSGTHVAGDDRASRRELLEGSDGEIAERLGAARKIAPAFGRRSSGWRARHGSSGRLLPAPTPTLNEGETLSDTVTDRNPLRGTDWDPLLRQEFEKTYWGDLQAFVDEQRSYHDVYPPPGEVFTALHLTPLAGTKVVILGQDPYHGHGQAHGLAFSVRVGASKKPGAIHWTGE